MRGNALVRVLMDLSLYLGNSERANCGLQLRCESCDLVIELGKIALYLGGFGVKSGDLIGDFAAFDLELMDFFLH